jgi:hypothetical protein
VSVLEQFTAMSQAIRAIEAAVRKETNTLEKTAALMAKHKQSHWVDACYEEARHRYFDAMEGGAA